MRLTALIAALALAVTAVWPQVMLPARRIVAPTPASDAPTFFIRQTFEGVGYDNGEAWTGVNVNPNYTNIVLEGAESLSSEGSGAYATSPSFSALDEIWGYFLVRWSQFDNGGLRIFVFLDNGANTRLTVTMNNTTRTLRVDAGGAPSATTVSGMAVNTTYHVWVHYRKGTGADAFGSVGFSTTGTEPTSGNNYAEVTTGTHTQQITQLQLGILDNGLFKARWDKVRADDVVIGDNPP